MSAYSAHCAGYSARKSNARVAVAIVNHHETMLISREKKHYCCIQKEQIRFSNWTITNNEKQKKAFLELNLWEGVKLNSEKWGV